MHFFFNDTATTEIDTLSLHDALPIFWGRNRATRDAAAAAWQASRFDQDTVRLTVTAQVAHGWLQAVALRERQAIAARDRKSTRLNSSHSQISYAVFCLKKKKNSNNQSNSTNDSTKVTGKTPRPFFAKKHHIIHAHSTADEQDRPPPVHHHIAIEPIQDI